MIKSSQAETLHQAGYLQKHRDVFFYEWPTIPTIDEICQKNSLKLPLSEWWDVYHDREKWIMDSLNKEHVVAIITEEECISWGL
jgi:hypothetical protein